VWRVWHLRGGALPVICGGGAHVGRQLSEGDGEGVTQLRLVGHEPECNRGL
jgi:hypothetical protein